MLADKKWLQESRAPSRNILTIALRFNVINRVRHLEQELDDEIRGELGGSALSDEVWFQTIDPG